jgi:Zn-dependent M28 family amino/carboxypeptidase
MRGLNRPPRRTVRFVLFGGEEEGLLGSAAYVRQHEADLDKIDAVLVTDSGSEAAKGWLLMGREDEKGALESLKPLLAGLGADGISSDTAFAFQTDHAPFEFRGVPELVLWTGVDKYDTLHHKASDTFDSVIQKDLAQGAAVIAVTAYAIADSPQAFAPHLSPMDVRSMAEKSDILSVYDYFKNSGALP